MVVRKHQRIEMLYVRVQKLLAQIRRRINEYSRAIIRTVRVTEIDQSTAPQPAVLRFGRVTGSPVISDPRNAAG